MFCETVERSWDAQDEMSTQHIIQYTSFYVRNLGTIIMKVQKPQFILLSFDNSFGRTWYKILKQ